MSVAIRAAGEGDLAFLVERHAERAGFVREGVKRRAYAGADGWVDGVLYALVEEDLDEPR